MELRQRELERINGELSRFVLPGKKRVSITWCARDLRKYNLDYIKKYKEYKNDVKEDDSWTFWIVHNLVALRKIKSAERIYFYLIEKGLIKPI